MESATTPAAGYDDAKAAGEQTPNYCSMPAQPAPAFDPGLDPARLGAIIEGSSKWVNGTVLHYYFFDKDTDGSTVRLSDGTPEFVSWVGPEEQRQAVRQAFATWKELGVGLEFTEVSDRDEAEVRIGFMDGDGSWSYLGRNVLGISTTKRTMNFGWDLTSPYGRTTALHEIGHTLGMPHEHQNPFAGIVWDEERVYEVLAGPPNNWPREQTFHNILRKLDPSEVQGSEWDPDSVMEYSFGPGLIKEPERYRNGISPPGGLSPADKTWAVKWYPTLAVAMPTLLPFKSVGLELEPAQQADFEIRPSATRRYTVGTFGSADTVAVLFEDVDGELRHVDGDDDSGEDRNARIRLKLFKGRRYVLRVRLYWAEDTGETAVMYW